MKRLIILGFFGLAACTGAHVNAPSAEPIVVTKEIAVAVDAACVPDTLKGPPIYVDTKAALVAAQDVAERLQLLYAGRAQREARLNEVEPVLAGCPRGSVKKK